MDVPARRDDVRAPKQVSSTPGAHVVAGKSSLVIIHGVSRGAMEAHCVAWSRTRSCRVNHTPLAVPHVTRTMRRCPGPPATATSKGRQRGE